MSLGWDVFQHFQIDKARQEASAAKHASESYRNRVDDVQGQIERLSLACQAMWELLRDHSGLTEEDLRAKLVEVDSRDGALDGKIAAEVIDCPHCGQKTSTRRGRCIFCGQRVEASHAFKR